MTNWLVGSLTGSGLVSPLRIGATSRWKSVAEVSVHSAGHPGAVLEAGPDELRVTDQRADDVNREQAHRDRPGHVAVLADLEGHRVLRQGRHRRVDGDVVLLHLRLLLGGPFDDLPGRLELDHARREDQVLGLVVGRIGLQAGRGLQAVLMDEVGERLVDVNAVVEGVAVLIDEDLAPTGLLDVAQEGAIRPVRLGVGEDLIDGRVLDQRRNAIGVGLHGDQEVLPAAAIEGALTGRVRHRQELRQLRRRGEPIAARLADLLSLDWLRREGGLGHVGASRQSAKRDGESRNLGTVKPLSCHRSCSCPVFQVAKRACQ